jgi:hypothetical protein
MGWRDTQRQVTSGELSFKPEAPSDFQQGIGMLLKTGANYIQDQEDRRREEAMKLMEEQKVKNEELNKKRKAKNALEKQRRSKAISILGNLGEDAKNTNFQRHVISNLELFDDDAAKVMEYYTELGNQLQSVASKKNMTARGRQGDLNQQTAEALGADTRAMFDAGAGDTKPPTNNDMEMRESSGVSTEVSINKKGDKYGGLIQMGQARLQDYNEKYGTNFTPDTFSQLPEGEQRKINNWHYRDISTFIRNEGLDEYVGEEINGTILTESSLVAVAHLGGKTGLKNYLISGGEKDRKDSNGTYMSTYAKDFADSSFMMEEEQDDPNFRSFIITDKKGLFDPFKKKDGTYHTSAQIQLIANDSGDPALIERANKITAPRINPSSLGRLDLGAKIAVMEFERRPEAEIAPYRVALQARNDQKAVDDIPDPTTAEGLYFQVEKALIPEGLPPEEYSKRIAAIKNSWNEATSSATFTPRTLYKIGSQTTTRVYSEEEYNELTGPDGGYSDVQLGAVEQIMQDFSIDREEASQLKNGFINISSDGLGRVVFVNKATGEQSYPSRSNQDMNSESEVLMSEALQEAMQSGQTGDPSNLSVPSVFYEDEQGNKVVITAEEKAAAASLLAEAGLGGGIAGLKDISSAFGPEGWAKKIGNNVSGFVFGTTFDENSAESKSKLEKLRTLTVLQLVSAFPNIRDSVTLKQQLASLIPEPGKLLDSGSFKPNALRGFKSVKQILEGAVSTQSKNSVDMTMSTRDNAKAQMALNSLLPLLEIYETIVEGFENPQSGTTPVGQSSYIKR